MTPAIIVAEPSMKTKRIRLRALTVAVAVAALAIWGWVLRRRSVFFASEADKHYHRLELCQANRDSIFDGYVVTPRREQLTEADKERLAYFERWVSYEKQLVRKYRRAAMLPLVLPEHDPPPPSPFHSWLH